VIKAIFDTWAQTYDRSRRQLVPCFDDFYNTALEQLPFAPDAAFRVLDLGAGTGLLSLFVSNAFPHARLTLVDIAPQMLERARERFAQAGDRFQFIVADYADALPEGEFDAVVSALSIHHLTDEQKSALFRKIYDRLTRGGVFVNAEQVLGATPEIDAQYQATWLRQVRARGVDDADLAAAIDRMRADRTAPLDAQLEWLRQAGFRNVNCWYKFYRFAVYAGCKG